MKLICVGCNRPPEAIQEYVEAGKDEDLTPDQYVWREEGTLNKDNGHFLCTECYIDAGMPETDGGWKAP